MVEALVLITDDASYHCQWIFSAVYALVIIHHGNMIFMFTANVDRHLVIELEG